MRWRVGLIAIVALLLLLPAPALAEESKNKGLFITPLRAYPTVVPGKTASDSFTIANITDQPVTVALSAGQFSVADYSYDYQFADTTEDWVRLSKTEVTLQPNKSQGITYTITAPKDATPGGHYFTLFATAQLSTAPTKVRVATVLYVTVDGKLTKTSRIDKASIPAVSFGTDIDFSLAVHNTGNTHFFAYSSGQLLGLSAKTERPQTTSLLLPDKSRIVSGTIPAPFLPGIYKVIYGFKTDDSQIVERTTHLLYLPPWTILLPAGGIWLFFAIRRHRKNKR